MMGTIFEYDFLVRSILAALFGSITAGIAGTYIVSRRLVFLSGGVTHASFGGIGLGYFLGINPVIGAAFFGIASAVSIEYLSEKQKVKEDSAIGFLWAFGMAVGIIFVYLTPGYTPNLMSYLFGSLLTIGPADLYALMGLTVILVLFFSFYYRTILYISFDESFARTIIPNVSLFKYILIVLVSLVIVLNIRIAGVVLVLSMLTLPPNIVLLFTRNFRKVIVWSVVTGFAGMISGLAASWFLDIPTGATVIFVLVITWIVLRLITNMAARSRRKQAV
ncbi:MAG: metal ABC transporter permease [Bacteroidales bacterium]